MFSPVGESGPSQGRLPQIVVISGGAAGQVRDLQVTQFTIGRRNDNDLILNSPAVSKYHVRIERVGDQFAISDLGSTNGTLVNRKPLEANKPRTLFHGDTISMGEEVLLFRQPVMLTDHQSGMTSINLDMKKVRGEVDDLLKGFNLND